jgi:hypothetical protein
MRQIVGGGLALASVIFLAACNGESGTEAGERDRTNGNGSPEATPVPSPTAERDEAARFRSTWPDTDFSNRTIDLTEILSGGVPIDGIPPLDAEGATSIPSDRAGIARFAPVEEIDIEGNLPVAFIEMEGEARAYPLHILTWHEIVNDVIGETAIAMTFCPLCNTAIAFDRRVDGQVLDFGVSGLLRHSDLVMWDRQTKSWWQQATGQGIVGELAGTQLRFLGAGIMSFADFGERYPNGLVLTDETGHSRDYGANPYVGYDAFGSFPFLFDGEVDQRIPPMERVVSLGSAEEGMAVRFSALEENPVATVNVGGEHIVVFWAPGTASALDRQDIASSADIGSAIAYSPVADGQTLSFSPAGPGEFIDAETESTWNISGYATSGPLAGTQLEVVPHTNIFWFAWAAFVPDTAIWEG